MTDITDVDEFTDPIQHAINAGETINAADVNTAIQGIANRTRNAKNRLDLLGIAAHFSVSGSGVADNGRFTLTKVADVGGTFNVVGDGIQVPAVGTYLCTWYVLVTASGTTDPQFVEARLGGTGGPYASFHRLGGSSSTTMHLSSAGILTISSLPSDIELLSLTNTVTLTGAGAPAGRIAIVKVA